jgi:choline dehydrogenase-like flavoprotein
MSPVLGAAPAPATPPRGLTPGAAVRGDLVLDADVVVVGSGAGGATVAAELAEAGFDVVILEEGGHHRTEDFTADTSAMMRRLYRDGGATLALGAPPVLYQEGRAVGGSTVINGGMSWRTPEAVLARWEREHRLPGLARELEPCFARVERRIHVAPMDDAAIGTDNRLLKRGADALGWRAIGNLRNQVHCAGSNRCAFGCPTGAKQSALLTYVPRALHYGARLYADVRADRILRHGKRAIGVTGTVVGTGHRISVRAGLVIAACGAIHTPALLARSGFRSPSGRLGHNLALHPNAKVVALFDEPVTSWRGAHQAYQVREFQREGQLLAAVGMPPSILTLGVPHRGAALGALMDRFDHMLLAGVLCEDTATGRVHTIGGRPQALYQLAHRDADNLQRGVARLAELLFAAGARRLLLPFRGAPEVAGPDEARRALARSIPRARWELLTVHLMGTAAMGADRSRAVTDPVGRVYDADRLMVVDASLFPTPIGVNPMETIMALATRAAAFIIDNARSFL